MPDSDSDSGTSGTTTLTETPAPKPKPKTRRKTTAESTYNAKAERAVRARKAAELLKQASDPTRLRVLLLLASEGEKNVGQLCTELGHSQPATSHHLALLRVGRLVEARREQKHNFYHLTESGRALVAAVAVVEGAMG